MADWERLAEQVVRRRVELGHRSRPALVSNSSLGLRTLGDIESARRTSYDKSTIAALESALRWEQGSVALILEGGDAVIDPTPRHMSVGASEGMKLDDAATASVARGAGTGEVDDPVVRVVLSDLPDAKKKRIIEMLLEERRLAARQLAKRADELISLLRDED